MSLSAREVLHIAKLAELEVPAEEMTALVGELDRIVGYVGQLAELTLDSTAQPFIAGPGSSPVRPDQVRPVPLARPLDQIAPTLMDGFFRVPRLPAMEAP
jgi:aspartyl-tRNA(Asn)/glutamyl-tRNA(Gln) amidotransferase subunit C